MRQGNKYVNNYRVNIIISQIEEVHITGCEMSEFKVSKISRHNWGRIV